MDLLNAIETGSANPLFLVSMAILLGGLHGLEPGHSKTMMAAFMIAVKGTITQAFLLGLSAAFSHTVIVWILALIALKFGNELIAEEAEPYFLMISGAMVILIGGWIFYQTRKIQKQKKALKHQHHNHHHHHHHPHTHTHDAHGPSHDLLDADAHARAHALDIETRFKGGQTTNMQTVLFGLSGGLIPCSAAITVLILCLHLDKFWMGVGMVGAFSAGLALTLIAIGVAASIGVKYAQAKSDKLDQLFDNAPYLSGFLILLVGIYMIASGIDHLGT